jgi:hypothetical protein
MMPYVITMVKPRPPPVEKPVQKAPVEPEVKEKLTARDMYQDMNWGLR